MASQPTPPHYVPPQKYGIVEGLLTSQALYRCPPIINHQRYLFGAHGGPWWEISTSCIYGAKESRKQTNLIGQHSVRVLWLCVCLCVRSVQGATENMLASHHFFTPAVLKNINETLCFYHIGLGSPITNLESFSPAPPPKKTGYHFS